MIYDLVPVSFRRLEIAICFINFTIWSIFFFVVVHHNHFFIASDGTDAINYVCMHLIRSLKVFSSFCLPFR
jgi:hypothetical protein